MQPYDQQYLPHTWTTSQVLAKQVSQNPHKIAVSFIGGTSFTYTQAHAISLKVAAGLAKQGVVAGDNVASLLPNVPEFCELWWGCHQVDAVLVGLNPELVGSFLVHVLNLCEAKILVCQQAHLPIVAAIADKLLHLKKIVVPDNVSTKQCANFALVSFSSLQNCTGKAPTSQASSQDLAALMFTSGTTGPSKAVMMPHAHCYLYGLGTIENLDLQTEDRYYITMPIFHCNGFLMQLYGCLIKGATAVIRDKFSASNWMKDIRQYDITHTNLLGVMSEFIDRQPCSDKDKDHKLKVIAAAPATPKLIDSFEQRFAVKMVELYGMSEANIPLYSPLDAPRKGSCGKVYERFFEVRIAHPETDMPLQAEEVGEIQVRPKMSGGFMAGYYRMPEETVKAWKNLWFHTGDAGKYDQDGYFYFIDRIKDCIRRRGENISSFEVEKVIFDYPGIEECAVIAVPSEIPGGEDEIMAVIECATELDPKLVITHCQQGMPAFAVPRYLRLLGSEQIPRTTTNKVRKVALRNSGITNDTYDMQSADSK